MGKRLLAMLMGAAALVLLSAGCGEDGDEGNGAGDERLTPAQYAKRATALCARHRRQISDELDAFVEARGRDGEAAGGIAAEAMEKVILSGFRAEYEELRKLPPPRGDEDFLDLMLSKFSRSLENGEESLTRFFRIKLSGYSEFAEGTLMTKEYGVKGCGSLGRSPQGVYAPF